MSWIQLYPKKSWLVALLAMAGAGILSGCGQVITPTPTPEPSATPTVAIAAVTTLPPTATPAPYTPAPTHTPTVTPTPIIYQIQPGDSLLGIAQRHSLSVSTLQDANGILDPRLLQVGQQLIIPSPEEISDDPQNATPTPIPLPVEVQNIYFRETNIGGLWVLGEVLNQSGSDVEQVRVAIVLLDEEDEEIARATGLVALDLVEVDQRAPFAILFGEVPSRFKRYQAFPISAVPAYVGSYYRDLVVEELTSEGERYASYTVEGVIRNIGPEESVGVQVVLTAYDSLDRVIAMRQVVPEHNVVAQGGETTFTAVLIPVGGPITRIEALAQGRRVTGAAP